MNNEPFPSISHSAENERRIERNRAVQEQRFSSLRSLDYQIGYDVGLSRKPYGTNRNPAKWWDYNHGYRDGWQDSGKVAS